MTDGSRKGPPPRRWAWLSFRRQQTLSLVVLAVVPVLALSLVGYERIRVAVTDAANAQAADAARAVRGILSRQGAQLDASVQSYATWSTLQNEVARLDLTDIQRDVLDFQVARGEADTALLLVGSSSALGGDQTIGAPLRAWLAAELTGAAPGADLGYTYASFGGGVYQVAAASISLGNRTGPGVTEAGGHPIGLVFARRLDSTFVLNVKQQTGFDVAVYDGSGSLAAASNLALVQGTDAGTGAGAGPMPGDDETVSSSVTLQDPTGGTAGTVLLVTPLHVIDVLGGELFPVLLALLGLTLAGALVGAALLSLRLRRRLGEVAAGIMAVAAGDLSTRLPEGDRDEIERLARSHNRLASALERRDGLIRDSFGALQRLRVDQGVDRLALDVVAAARSVFDLSRCWLRGEDGSVIAVAPAEDRVNAAADQVSSPAGQVNSPAGQVNTPPDLSEAATGEPAPVWLEAVLHAGVAWTTADRALFALFAREVGVALRDASLYERAERHVDRLTRVNALQRDFLRGVSHNLQTPVTAIIAASDDLRDQAAPGSDARQELDLIHARALRLSHTVGQLLTIARLDAGVYQPDSDPVALGPIARRAWAALGSRQPFDIDDRSNGALALADRASLDQAIWILLDNAVKYAPDGDVRVEIGVVGDELNLRVVDRGPGVPADERTRIFARFERGSSSAGRDGTGLGLAVARGMIEAMGGRIWYEDRPGGGAVFAFALPAEVATEPS